MLNPFPTFIAFGLFAPVFIRLFLGITFITIAYLLVSNKADYTNRIAQHFPTMAKAVVVVQGILYTIMGILFVVGLYTQIVALFGILITLKAVVLKKKYPEIFTHSYVLYLALLTMSLSLLFSGAGFLAYDLPL